MRRDQVRLFERIVESIGELAMGGYSAAGFDIGYVMRPDGIPQGQSWTPNPLDPMLPIARISNDNERARGYGFQRAARPDLFEEYWRRRHWRVGVFRERHGGSRGSVPPGAFHP